MVAIFISFFIVVLSFNFFVISYQINGINRLVISAPLSLYETSINLFEIDDSIGPVFDKEILEDNITSYFDYHIPRYTNDYSLQFYYYNPIDHSIELSENAKAVEVELDANLALNYHYAKTMYYEIWSN